MYAATIHINCLDWIYNKLLIVHTTVLSHDSTYTRVGLVASVLIAAHNLNMYLLPAQIHPSNCKYCDNNKQCQSGSLNYYAMLEPANYKLMFSNKCYKYTSFLFTQSTKQQQNRTAASR